MGTVDVEIAIGTSSKWMETKRRLERLETKRISKTGSVSSLVHEPSTSESGQRTHSGDAGQNHEANDHVDFNLCRAARENSVYDFNRALEEVITNKNLLLSAVFNQVTPIGNTYLHIAVSSGYLDVVDLIVCLIGHDFPSLITKKNFNGETPLHLAVKSGYSSVVEMLVQRWKDSLNLPSGEGTMNQQEDQENSLLRLRNEKGNTALHEALINGKEDISCVLIKADPAVVHYLNNDRESALYLAAKAGSKECISCILSFVEENEILIEKQKPGKSPVHAAIKSRKYIGSGILDLMLEKVPGLIHLKDEGRFPLHYAASMGYLKEVQYLIDKFAPSANVRDEHGLLPVHWASIKGHVAVIRTLLLSCPGPEELLDLKGRNILHIAAESGSYEVVRYILENQTFNGLIDMKDKEGNTPLHLAAMNWHPKIASALTWDSSVNLKVVNGKGMTALDAAEHYIPKSPSFRQQLTWAALKAGGVPRALSSKSPNIEGETSIQMEMIKSDYYKYRVNTLLLVSTLVATVTFTAGFTMPGGYNNTDPNQGIATMLEQRSFHVFIFCDAIAIYSSIVVAVSLIWAQLGEPNLANVALRFALPLLGIALTMMCLAFTAGVYVVVSKLKWLATAILIMGAIFLVILSALFFPFCFPLTSKNHLLRHILYYPFCLLMFVTGADRAVNLHG